MASFQLWDSDWATSTYLPVIFALSTKYNMRRLEDSSYAIWTAVLLSLCGGVLTKLLICPQYGLFVSPKEESNPNDSNVSAATVSDDKARGVIVDNCVILPEPEFRASETANSVYEYFRTILKKDPHSPEGDLRIAKAQVPVLVEQKRPPPRHGTIYTYFHHVVTLLNSATDQAEQQYHCLFSMRKFGLQDDVIVIATSGPWWKFRYVRRDTLLEASAFQLKDYEQRRMDEALATVGEETYAEDEESVLTTPAVAALAARLPDGNEGKGMKLDEEVKVELKRVQREAKRREQRNAREHAKIGKSDVDTTKLSRGDREEWKKFLDEAGTGPFTPEQLDKCSEFAAKMGRGEAPFCHVYPQDLVASQLADEQWTKPMRLGTDISNKYLEFIRSHLQKLADAETTRREAKETKDGRGRKADPRQAVGGPGRTGSRGEEKGRVEEKEKRKQAEEKRQVDEKGKAKQADEKPKRRGEQDVRGDGKPEAKVKQRPADEKVKRQQVDEKVKHKGGSK